MANIPIKWGKVGTDGKAEVNGADNTTFNSSSPAFKVNGDEEITGDSSVGGDQSVTGDSSVGGSQFITGDETVGGNGVINGNLIVNKDNTTNKVGINIASPTEALEVSGNAKATKFIGDLQGNSDTATKATQDGDGNTISSTYTKVTGDPTIFNNSDMPQGAANLSTTATTHRVTVYRNGLSIPYQMDNPNDGGILRVRGTSESTCVLELGTWDDSGSGETIQFNYYPTTSQITPTYSASVPKVTGTLGAFTATPASGKVIVTDGTTGGMKASGYGISEGNTASTVVARNANGYIYGTYFNASCGNETKNYDSTSGYHIYCNTDGWLRKATAVTQLYSGSLAPTGQCSWANYKAYSKYLVIASLEGGNATTTTIVPRNTFTSSRQASSSYIIADDAYWCVCYMWYSGTTGYLYMEAGRSDCRIKYVFGLN